MVRFVKLFPEVDSEQFLVAPAGSATLVAKSSLTGLARLTGLDRRHPVNPVNPVKKLRAWIPAASTNAATSNRLGGCCLVSPKQASAAEQVVVSDIVNIRACARFPWPKIASKVMGDGAALHQVRSR